MTSTKSKLTKVELSIFDLLLEGKTQLEIAELLGISKHTVKNHVVKILKKKNQTTTLKLVVAYYKGEI